MSEPVAFVNYYNLELKDRIFATSFKTLEANVISALSVWDSCKAPNEIHVIGKKRTLVLRYEGLRGSHDIPKWIKEKWSEDLAWQYLPDITEQLDYKLWLVRD